MHNVPVPTPTQLWFRQRPVVAGLMMVPVTMTIGALAAPVGRALGLPWALWLVLLVALLGVGFAVSRVLTGVLMGRDDR